MDKILSTRLLTVSVVVMTLAAVSLAQDTAASDKLLDRIISGEQGFLQQLRSRTPLVETYIQETRDTSEVAQDQDYYYLGRLSFTDGMKYSPLIARPEPSKKTRRKPIAFAPAGFAQMIFIDEANFNRRQYSFEYIRREFSGGLRCLVFDVTPVDKKARGRFIGRIWVEDLDLRIVRFNGTYTGSTNGKLYFHFDSWRLPAASAEWVPAMIYVEEGVAEEHRTSTASFKAQTRIWGYNSGRAARLDELTSLAVELQTPSRESPNTADTSPLENQRSWEHQAEQNIFDRLEKGGMLAVKGPVDQVLDTVIGNLLATNNLNIEVHGRVLLTTPFETFTVGRAIVVSRGLLDVLPDEASLAMVLSGELAHIALGHRTPTQYAFNNQTMFSDEELLQRFRFSRSPEEIEAADIKAVELLSKSPYQSKLSNAGLFLKALASRAPLFPSLIRANIGNRLADAGSITRMTELVSQAPSLEDSSLEQIAALPLGSRIKLDPWTDGISLIKAKPVSLLTAREKLLFEITPFLPSLTRGDSSADSGAKQ